MVKSIVVILAILLEIDKDCGFLLYSSVSSMIYVPYVLCLVSIIVHKPYCTVASSATVKQTKTN